MLKSIRTLIVATGLVLSSVAFAQTGAGDAAPKKETTTKVAKASKSHKKHASTGTHSKTKKDKGTTDKGTSVQ